MAGCHKNSMNIILRYLNAVSQSNVKIDTCKVSHLARLNPERWHFHFWDEIRYCYSESASETKLEKPNL